MDGPGDGFGGGFGGGFGERLRAVRTAHGPTQAELSELLDGVVARSTITNVETGRSAPSYRLLRAIVVKLPDWAAELGLPSDPADLAGLEGVRGVDVAPGANGHEAARRHGWRSGGSFDLESLTICYLFDAGRSPSEIIEVRRVRARRNGASAYGLRLAQHEEDFTADTEAPWGGGVRVVSPGVDDGQRAYYHEVAFDRLLQRGERHEFAVRTRIERDPDPGTAVHLDFSIPVREVDLHLGFRGMQRPVAVEVFGPLAEGEEPPERPRPAGRRPLPETGRVHARFVRPALGPAHGVCWEW